MKNSFSIDQKDLSLVLAAMQPICTKRTTVDTTTQILFQIGRKELILKSTDLEISLQYSCLLEKSTLDKPQSFLVSGKKIFDLVKELDGEITFQLTKELITLTAGSAHLSLHIRDAQEFPPFPERIENIMHVSVTDLLGMLEKVLFLIPQNNANPALNGLLIEVSDQAMKMTATDGHCLAQVVATKYTLKEPKSWLLPRRTVLELKKVVEASNDEQVFIGICENQLVFSGVSFNFFSKLLVDNFPQYQAIMDRKGFFKAAIKKDSFVKTLRRSACLLSGQFIATQFGFDKQELNVAMQNKDVGTLEETLSLEQFEGAKLDVRFYAPYLLSGLQVFPTDTVQFYLGGAARPVIFEFEKDAMAFTYLAMPVSPTAGS